MSTRNISWEVGSKGGRCVGLETLILQMPTVWDPEPPGTLRACLGIALLLFDDDLNK